jgi:hypothetical protein
MDSHQPLLAILLLASLVLAGCATQAAPTSPQEATQEPGSASPSISAGASPADKEHQDKGKDDKKGNGEHAGKAPTRVGHVFIIVLENQGYNNAFPATSPPSPYLATTLTAMGRLLPNYYGTGHASLDNYISMVSGQAPNPVTQGDCALYADFREAIQLDGQAIGQGCVYPKDVPNVADQIQAAHHTWKAYAEDMANLPGPGPTACRHQPINSQDTWQGSTDPKDQYATRHVPFVYFHGIIDDQAYCNAHVVDLANLQADLQSLDSTPEYVFITPDVCSDGHDGACVNPDQQGGYGGVEEFLRAWVPRILNSTAYQQDGLLVINFDEADVSPSDPDSATACCGEQAGFNTAKPGIWGPGGGRTGAVLLSPCIPSGSVDPTPYNHYSLLRTTEDIFQVDHIGYAAQAGLTPIDLGICHA